MTRLGIITVLLATAFVGEDITVAVQYAKAQTDLPRVALQRSEQPPALANQAAIPKPPQPFDEAPLPSDAKERANREAKNRRYNRGERAFAMTGPDEETSVVSGCPAMMPLFPVIDAPVIVIGTVMGKQPYLGEDRSFIYTECAIQVEEFLKKETNTLLKAGEKLIVDYAGGKLRLRNGHIISYSVTPCSMARPLQVGERCVLFLFRINDGVDLSLLHGFLLRNGQAYVLGRQVEEEMLVGGLRDVPKEFSHETDLLKALRQAIANPSSPPFYEIK